MSAKKQFSHRLKLLRKIRGLSQGQLSERIGRSVETISHLERGLSFPNAETLDRLCKTLQVPPREFFSVAKDDADRQHIIDEIDTELLKLQSADLQICLEQIRALSNRAKFE